MNTSIVEAVFQVHANLLPGEEVRVSGNVPALGCDNPDRSIPLCTTSADFPWWTTKDVIYLPGGQGVVTYKYCIFSGGKFDRWEAGGNLERKFISKYTEDKFGEVTYNKQNAHANVSSMGDSYLSRQYASWTHSNTKDNSLTANDTVLIVAYFLPVILSKSPDGRWSAKYDQENILSVDLDCKIIRVGSIRYMGAPIPVEEEDAVSRVLADMRCYPVFINENMHFQFYDIFCKQTLWPLVHHISDVYGPLNQNEIGAKAQQNVWFVYSTVHKLFRDKILEVFYDGFLIWINGFHLMLLPSFLRRRLPTAKIGYFLHTPFPSSEIWRTVSRREDLLRGILGADQIGFHLFEYCRHFLTTCRRLMGCSYEINPGGSMTVSVDGREVAMTCIHVGVNQENIDELMASNRVCTLMKSWKEQFPKRIIVAGIDRLERLKGIPLKLMSIDRFMEENRHWLGRIVFAIIGISAMERGQDYHYTRHDVSVQVEQLNKKYSHPNGPLVYFEERGEGKMRLQDRLAFFGVADILMVTPTRDGLNRVPMEFTLARRKQAEILPKDFLDSMNDPSLPRFGDGLAIVSEFMSSARVMRGALTVNPWRMMDMVSALKLALEMSDDERADRSRRNLEFSKRLTTKAWALQVLNDLKAVEKQADSSATLAVGFGMQYKVMDLKAGFKQLNIKHICNDYRRCNRRLILLDWGGTLVADSTDRLRAFALASGLTSNRFEKTDAYEGSLQEVYHTLEQLCFDPKNVVFVISGKECLLMTDSFGSIKGLGLAAEHGFFYKWPTPNKAINDRSTNWQTITEIGDESWKSTAKMVMELYVQRTHGAYVEQKGNALIWQFRDADPEFGYLQSKELEEHLANIMAGYPVDVIRGGGVADGYIEVRPAGVSKGLFLEHALSTLESMGKDAEFVLAIGDDSSDEPMFDRLADIGKNKTYKQLLSPYGVTVGKKPTLASSFVDDTAAVIELLTSLTKSAARGMGGRSATELVLSSNSGSFFNDSPNGSPSERQNPITGSVSQTDLPMNDYAASSTFSRSTSPPLVAATSNMQRSTSLLNMQVYMNSINESNEEDDGAIFF